MHTYTHPCMHIHVHTSTHTRIHAHTHTDTRTQKTDPVTRSEKAVAIIGNVIGLYSVLTLCFFIWFTRLYVSWACIESSYDFLLLCQLTNQIQCYSCENAGVSNCVDKDLVECVKHPSIEPFHCLSPTYTMDIDDRPVSTDNKSGCFLFVFSNRKQHVLCFIVCRVFAFLTTTLDFSHSLPVITV